MSLWEEAYNVFEERLRKQSEDSFAIERFLEDQATLDDARQSVVSLRDDSDRKYGLSEGHGKRISSKWIGRIMENLDAFTRVGDAAMQAAPQSVGMVWFAIRLTSGAIQNDYKLYGTFHAGLNDISEMMVLIRRYDSIYQCYSKQNDGSIYQDLYKSITEIYLSILDFSFAVRKYIAGGKRSKFVHALKDTVGLMNHEFEQKSAMISAQKANVIEYAQAVFQETTTNKLNNVSDEMVSMHKTMSEAFDFHHQASVEWKAILSELKVSVRPSHRDLAVLDHEKNMNRLGKSLDSDSILAVMAAHVAQREKGTCDWVQNVPEYSSWRDGPTSTMLCISGEAGSGKSVLGASICETLRNETSNDARILVQYTSQDAKSSDEKTDMIERIENSLLRELYKHARDEGADEMLLQRCNELFTQPKQSKARDGSGRNPNVGGSGRGERSSDTMPEFLDIYPGLVRMLDKRVVLIIDAIDGLSEDDQGKLAEHLIELRNAAQVHIRILLLCWPSSPVRLKTKIDGATQIMIANHNETDIKLVISCGLRVVPSFSPAERSEIEEAIRQKAGHRIRYVKQVALPFLHTPLKRPLTNWLADLPENVNETYHQHLHHLTPVYRHLLQSLLAWTMVAERPPQVEEIMDAYSHKYLSGTLSDEQTETGANLELYREQIRKAAGPFVDIRDDNSIALADVRAVRDFCSLPSETTAGCAEEQSLCSKCKAEVQPNDRIIISEKEEHLNMAIICSQSFAQFRCVG